MGSAILGLLGYGVGSMVNYHSNQNANETNILQTELANQSNERINQQQMAHADRAAAEADWRTRQLYNDLYSPAAKVKQLKDAGLSVGLMYGQGGMGGNGQAGTMAQTPAAIPMQAAHVNPIMDVQMTALMAQAAKQLAETENIKSETKKNENELPEIQQRILESQQRVEKIKQDMAESQQRVDNLIAEKENIIADMRLKGKEAEAKEAETKLNEAKTEWQKVQTQIANIELETKPEMLKAQLDNITALSKQYLAAARKLNLEGDIVKATKDDVIKLATEQLNLAIAQTGKTEAETAYYTNLADKVLQGTASDKDKNKFYNAFGKMGPFIRTFIEEFPFKISYHGDM